MSAAPHPDRPVRSVPASPGKTGGTDSSRTVRVPWRATSVSQVRKTLVEDLESRSVEGAVVDEAEIVISELLSNAVRHARPLSDGNLRVHWKVKAGVVEVEAVSYTHLTLPTICSV